MVLGVSATTTPSPTRWTSVPTAAGLLGLTAGALRKTIERNAVKVADGGTEAHLDGLRARKLGRLWRVTLGSAWSDPVPAAPTKGVRSSASQSVRDGRDGAPT
jgi:hypothetical protein